MRFIVLLLIFAIGFSGFSAAAHAFDSAECNPVVSFAKDASSPAGGDDLADAGKETSKDSGHLCFACSHCCMTHVVLPHAPFKMTAIVTDVSFPMVDAHLPDSLLSGFKRPPKSLV